MFASGQSVRSRKELLAFLRSRSVAPVTRFAPAPTGALHLGHVVNAVYVWGLARALGGRVVLRIEDHDRQRSRQLLEQQMLDDLDWLGLDADVYPTPAYRHGACEGRQSERDAIYRQALAPVIAAGLIYGCDCTRATQASLAAPDEAPGERRYPGTCRERGIPLRDGVGWRLWIDPGVEHFDDGIAGPQSQDPSRQCGDLLLRDRLGNWTYQCVAPIDDHVQGVSLVVRGQDLLASTGRQIRLARLIGRSQPATFVHHPLVMKSAAQKLSKSDGDSGIADLRSAGCTPDEVIARAAQLAGLTDRARVAARDLAALFADG
jgi:glutamyl-tRNA synthetase/glutamyl-Q tRNA(Asp) synthetase